MIVFKNDIATTFKVVYKSSWSPITNHNDVRLTFVRINADSTEYYFPAEIVSYDCYNRLLEIESTVSLDTGEYRLSLWTIGAYSLDYSADYERIDAQLLELAVDNANVKRENDLVVDDDNVAYIE